MNPSAESAQYLFTLVMISLHNSSQHTTSQQVTLPAFCHHIGKVLPCLWQSFANVVAKPCQLVGKKDKSNIAVRKEAEARPQYNSANGKETGLVPLTGRSFKKWEGFGTIVPRKFSFIEQKLYFCLRLKNQ